ncbi:hypothetical protein B0T16DRAFT_391561 [Cercophora newfieldiana]|uniref:Uncharacterized protein n=1 Tax=Cercophora newfieldiana TaxID=92897 RepID=A0AA39XZ27_9PEZI|nr:hypothetical protein B0T16DRAFT_391561 [Cercophora newfieldiana]
MTPSSVIDAGTAIGGGIDFSTSTLILTGGKSSAPKATTAQLKALQQSLPGVQIFDIGGTHAQGASLDLEEHQGHQSDGASDPASVIRSGDAKGGKITISGNKFEATGGIGGSSKCSLSQVLKAKRDSGATGVVVEGGEAKGAVIIVPNAS